ISKHLLTPDSDKNDIYVYKQWRYKPIPKPKLLLKAPAYIDFELYIKEKCGNKIKVLNRETFPHIKRPIVIMFNHFREKCTYHTKWLDRMYELSIKYGDRIEFIAADLFDMDIIFPGRNPLKFFSIFVRPEDVTPTVYALDEKKCVHELLDVFKEIGTLTELCENLLKGKLFPSQPLPENNKNNLVKICVHNNHKELVLKSSKNIFLIINLKQLQENETNYNQAALALKDYNLDIVYMQAEENYIPFEYYAYGLPTLIFIPLNDKKNFVYYEDMTTEESTIEFLKNLLEQPDYLPNLQQQQKNRMKFQAVQIAHDFLVDYDKDLEEFLEKIIIIPLILNRDLIDQSSDIIIVAFMDFQGKCLAHHVNWFNKLYQVASILYGFQFMIADFKEIAVINSKWKPEDLILAAQGKPKIYGFDRLKHTFEFNNYKSPASLFYFADSLDNGDFYYSQDYSRNIEKELVKDWPSNYFNFFLKHLKKHIFITFYSASDEKAEKLLILLQEIVEEVKSLNVEVVKFNVDLNYVDLEYKQDSYAVSYFIPLENKRDNRTLRGDYLNRENILEFIKFNVENG
ncbi:LOW QUALITY PROTEIN: uncharacterized protein LOC119614928, partial [Lucilia sericata]|uniref:LOW QUALITY PROTEIN: uncharacterized protein LOC119614928 n=1 Tax=Lucilia sericata TaxID=13632 RepID=UPI0018A7F185